MKPFTNLFRRPHFQRSAALVQADEEAIPLLTARGKTRATSPSPLYPAPGLLARLEAHVSKPGRFRSSAAASSQAMLHPFGSIARYGAGSTPLDDLPAVFSKTSAMSNAAMVSPRSDIAVRLQHKLAASRQQTVGALFERPAAPAVAGVPAAPCSRVHLALQQVAALFPGADSIFFEQLQVALHALPLSASADRSLIACALASASGGNIAAALRMLQSLAGGLDLHAGAGCGHQCAPLLAAGAWKVAGMLARTEDGYAMLRSLHPTHAGFGRAARVLLQASTERDHAATALAARATGAAYRMLTPDARLSDAEKAAVFAWEQGFRQDGHGSPLQAVQARLGKFVRKTIPRVKASRLKSFLPRLLGMKKSPLSAVGHGMHGAQRSSLKVERAAISAALKATTGHLYQHLVRDADAILTAASPLAALAAVASLGYWHAQPAPYPGQRITVSDLPALAQQMQQVLGCISTTQRRENAGKFAALASATHALGRAPAKILAAQSPLRQLLREPVSAKRLARWGKLRSITGADPFWRQLDLLGRRQAPRSLRPKSRCIHGARQSLRTLVDDMAQSARVRFADGGTAGCSTKGVAINLSNLMHITGVPIGGRVNIGATWGRRSVFEIGRDILGGEILIGSERVHRRTRGLGVFLGYDFRLAGARLRCGISADCESSREERDFAGVTMRVLERKRADGSADVARTKFGMQKIMNFMFDAAHDAHRARGLNRDRQLFNRFAAAFFDDPDIALGFNQPHTVCKSQNATLGASVDVKLPGSALRIGPGIGITAAMTALRQHDGSSSAGRLQDRSNRVGKIREVTLRAGLKGKIGVEAGEQPGRAPLGSGMFDTSLPEWIIPLHVSGNLARARLIRKNGRLHHRSCNLDIESSSIEGHIAVLDADRERWIVALAHRYAGNPDPIARARTELATYLNAARHHARHNQRFIQRMHLREDVARSIDSHSAMAALIRENTHLPMAQRERLCAVHETACAALAGQPHAWVPHSLKVLEKSSSHARLGLTAGFHLMTDTAAEGEHQLVDLKIGSH